MSFQEIKKRVLSNDVGGIIHKSLQRLLPGTLVTALNPEDGELTFHVKFPFALTLQGINKLVSSLRVALYGFKVGGTSVSKDPSSVVIHIHKEVVSELIKKQEQLDVNGDGEIDGTDLRKLREGKKPGDGKEEARIKGDDEYQWLVFNGKPIGVENDKGRVLRLNKGDKYGARKSSNGKFIRLVTEKEGLTKVFTCDMDLATYLGKHSKVA